MHISALVCMYRVRPGREYLRLAALSLSITPRSYIPGMSIEVEALGKTKICSGLVWATGDEEKFKQTQYSGLPSLCILR